ncbi:MAG: hypothetical protein IE921_04240 [Rhodobacteraceae bacterium]|nr:hypothetical protein [Paracoccaceae bacterium]
MAADMVALTTRRTMRWRPGLSVDGSGAPHSEIFAAAGEASGAGLALALALDRLDPEDRRPILWVQTRETARLTGRPYRAGLPAALRDRVIHVLADKAQDALFALEEGLHCRDLAGVLGEISGNPKQLDFTASRRLSLAAEKYGVPLWLIRLDAGRDLSSARMRWQAAAAPSAPPRWNSAAPGDPCWRAELFRARSHAPGKWILHHDGQTLNTAAPEARPHAATTAHPVGLVFAAGARSLAAG